MFLLSGLYCALAVLFLVVFGLQSLLQGRDFYGMVLLGFAGATVGSYLVVWYLGTYEWGSHLVVMLFGLLCLMLYYSGGQQGTGPMWYFVFPVFAMFLQGPRTGLLSVAMLLLLTFLLAVDPVPGLQARAYSTDFLQRLLVIYLAISALSYLFAHFRFEAESKLAIMDREMETISSTDKLSGLLNRRGMEDKLADMELTHTRFQMPFSLILFDIDDFKQINDSQGIPFGDYVIAMIGEICMKSLRKIDIPSRWAGDEFLMLLPGTHIRGAEILAERLRDAIDESTFAIDGKAAKVTASFGVCEHQGPASAEESVRKVDDLLNAAKARGHNQIVPESPGEDPASSSGPEIGR